jgi:rod shape-determining protein MreC
MGRIFLFLYQYRAFFTFLFLEVFCAWLIVQNNQYQGAKFFNSANSLVGGLNTFSQDVRDYFLLRDVNATLAEENTMLRNILEQVNQQKDHMVSSMVTDSTFISRFDFISARVINNSVSGYTNYITINKGLSDGIEPGMAVISSMGAVGKVKRTSRHFSVVTSVLNINLRLSGMLKRTGHFGTIQWNGRDPQLVEFEYIPRHVKPVIGDTVITSGYSGVFPEGIVIGTVETVELLEETPFYEIRVKLVQDFYKLSFVTVIKSNLLHELDSLEQLIPDMKR